MENSKPDWRKVTVLQRAAQLAALDRALKITRQSRNAWIRGLIDEAAGALLRRAERKLSRCGMPGKIRHGQARQKKRA
ncbi:MAG: hypothetical protein AAB368_11115 [bacterium]